MFRKQQQAEYYYQNVTLSLSWGGLLIENLNDMRG